MLPGNQFTHFFSQNDKYYLKGKLPFFSNFSLFVLKMIFHESMNDKQDKKYVSQNSRE